MTANEFWAYVNNFMNCLLLPRNRCEQVRNFLKWVSSVNLRDYSDAKKAFDSCIVGK